MGRLKEIILVGVNFLKAGYTDFASWSEMMVGEFGPQIEPHLEAIMMHSQELHAALDAAGTGKLNCWEFHGCDVEPLSDYVIDYRVCAATWTEELHGVHGGKNAGRACWAVVGSMSCGDRENICLHAVTCEECDFYKAVMEEEGDNFVPAEVLREMYETGEPEVIARKNVMAGKSQVPGKKGGFVANNILVVDDEPNIVLSLKFLLHKEGYEVRTAASGEEALQAIAEKKPDLVLLDIMMPAPDGYEVCQIIRNTPEWKDIPVIMLTAKGREIEKEKGLAMGADDYVTKPFATQEVVAKVRGMLGGKFEKAGGG
jgi:CheY-like chemotaxis protein